MNTYVLKPRPPVRAFIIAGVLSLLGALLVVWASSRGAAMVWVVLAAIVLVLGIALAVLGAISMVNMRTFITLDEQGYRIKGPGVDKGGSWADVTRVTTTKQGAHLTMYHGEVGRTHIMCPGGADDPQMAALAQDIADHLDHDRGYRNYEG